jgi:serine/threonine-protein kinase
MLPTGFDNEQARQRFRREARAAASLRSPHVVTVHDVGELPNGTRYIVMEYLEGQDLGAVMRQRKILPVSEAIGYMLDVCDALAEAHGKRMVHRDLKPANLFLTTGHQDEPLVKVVDFGIAKVQAPSEDEARPLTATAAVMGTPPYMSPEQVQASRDVDARSDLWSLGVILYYFVTGHRPFNGEIPMIFVSIVSAEPRPPEEINPDISPALSAVILRCLQKNPRNRYSSAGELARALQAIARTLPQDRFLPPPGSEGTTPLSPGGLAPFVTETNISRANQGRAPMRVAKEMSADIATSKVAYEDDPATVPLERESSRSNDTLPLPVSLPGSSSAVAALSLKEATPRHKISAAAFVAAAAMATGALIALLVLFIRAPDVSTAVAPLLNIETRDVTPPPALSASARVVDNQPLADVAASPVTPSASASSTGVPSAPVAGTATYTPKVPKSSGTSAAVQSTAKPTAVPEATTASLPPAPSNSAGTKNVDDWKKRGIH